MLYAPSTKGFYDPSINGLGIPADAVEITDQQYAALMAAQATGQVIEPDDDGLPVAVDAPVVPVVIDKVTMRQARLQLVAMGQYATVCAAVEQMGDAAKIEWEYAQDVERGNPITAAVIQLLGLTEQQVDDMFEAAALL